MIVRVDDKKIYKCILFQNINIQQSYYRNINIISTILFRRSNNCLYRFEQLASNLNTNVLTVSFLFRICTRNYLANGNMICINTIRTHRWIQREMLTQFSLRHLTLYHCERKYFIRLNLLKKTYSTEINRRR